MTTLNWFAVAVIFIATTSVLHAQEDTEPIEDNSFLIEEAYNQQSGEVQHILNIARDDEAKSWSLNFAQEWPLAGQEHQISYDVPYEYSGSGPSAIQGIGDISINYRYQILGIEEGSNMAFAPRLSVILPTGSVGKGLGYGVMGGEVNLPLSIKLASSLVAHTNVGLTLTPNAKIGSDLKATLTEIGLAQSIVFLLHPKFNALVEAVWNRTTYDRPRNDLEAEESFTINPGIRWAHDFDNGLQIVPGVSVPIGIGPDATTQVFVYLSFEHGF
jgi:hypothetical protein